MNSNLEKKRLYLIYQITNLLNSKIYVGAHITYNENDKYMGSSKYLKKDMKELGRHNFRKEILHIFDNKDDMNKKEAEIVNREFCHRSDTYNQVVGGMFKFAWVDLVCVKDKDENKFVVYCDDPRYISGELVHRLKGNKSSSPNTAFKNGHQHSQLSKDKMSEGHKKLVGNLSPTFGTKWSWITNGEEIKKIKKEDEYSWIEKGWCKGNIKLKKEDILNFNTNFNKRGWIKDIADAYNLSRSTVRMFVKNNLPELWKNNYQCLQQ